LGARRIDKIEDRFKTSRRLLQGMAGHDDSRTAMPFAAMIEGEFDLRPLRKMPLGKQADSLGRPANLILNQADRIRKTNRDLSRPYILGFA
jgi:hypothetical protein